MKNIAVIGAGTMGNGIAHVFALNEYNVSLADISEEALDQGMSTIEKNLNRQVKKEKISESDKSDTLDRISTFTSTEKAVKDAELIVEAATEKVDLKLDIFRTLDQSTEKEAILASNTSSISITKIASVTDRPEKVIGMHFMNPVPVMKLVEVIRGYATDDTTTEQVMEVAQSLNKSPVEVNDYPGFVANRILMPMINEAIESLHQGVAGVKEIDTVMKLGMGHPMGPLELADFIGLDVCQAILDVLHDGFGQPKYAPSPLLINMVEADDLGVKSGQGFYNYENGIKNKEVAESFQS